MACAREDKIDTCNGCKSIFLNIVDKVIPLKFISIKGVKVGSSPN